jgi:hypothetical protein
MHLLDNCKGRCYCVTGGVGGEGEERREAGKSGDVAGRWVRGSGTRTWPR